MMIAPVIFCTIVLGVGAVRKAATVGKIGGLAFLYFLVMTTFALGIGLVIGNLLHPGGSLKISASMTGKGADLAGAAHESGGAMDFVKNIIPTTLFSSLTAGNVLQPLFVALLVGFAIQALGSRGEPMLRAVGQLQGPGVQDPGDTCPSPQIQVPISQATKPPAHRWTEA